MEVVVEKCCGLDVHQASVVACVILSDAGTRGRKQTRTFGATMGELEALRAWLREIGCTHVAMESTGVYWMPVYQVLEGHFEIVVGNASHIKAVPGRKTDVKDAEWLADLVRHGLIRKSFVPPKWQRELRELVRFRRKLVEQRTTEQNRLMKVLEISNVKLSSVVSDVFGVSGRAMVRALIEGKASAEEVARLARGSLRKKEAALASALRGQVDTQQRFLLQLQLDRVERMEKDLEAVDEKIDATIAPHGKVIERLKQLPGVERVTAVTFLAEAGPDMSVFPTANHLAAWAGLCPGNNESAGKRKSQRKRSGNVHLATALIQAAIAASRKKGTYFKEKFWRLKARRGSKRAAVAIARHIIIAAYHMLQKAMDFTDLGSTYLDRIDSAAVRRRLVKRLEASGCKVTIVLPSAPEVCDAAPA